jgi:hypothetical protein
MSLEDQFYLLIVDEVRAQPGMLAELETLHPTRKILQVFGTLGPLLGPTGAPELAVNAAGIAPKVINALGQEPVDLKPELERWQASRDELEQNYMTLGRSALVYMLWRNTFEAEEAINRAKYQRDNWAFAHYVYGLLRGLQGDAGKAHFELYLAVYREPFPEARARVERALDLVR